MADLIDNAVALAVVPHDRPVQLAQLPFDRVTRVADRAAHVGGVPIEPRQSILMRTNTSKPRLLS
jgi:hypothetical protein